MFPKSNAFNFSESDRDSQTISNPLVSYLHLQSPEIMSRVAQSISPNVKEIISHNVQGLVGILPSESFNIQITTDREDLAGLLASAMMTGYFLRQMEQRMEMESILADSNPFSPGE